MANQTITQLPNAGPIQGDELVPVVQNGGTFKTTASALAGSPVQTQTFLTVNLEPTLDNSRYLSGGTGVGLVDGGAQSYYRVVLNGVSGTLETMGNGFAVNVGGTMVPRNIAVSGAGLSASNGDGQSGNPTVALSGTVASLANNGGTGFLALPGNGTVSGRVLTGTANQIDVADGNGVSGNPTFSLADNLIFTGTEGVTLPNGTTGERPASPNSGEIRYNSSLNQIEAYTTGWTTFGTGDGTVTSVNADGGTTGLTFTGGPITSSGTLVLSGTPVSAENVAGGAAYKVVYQTATDTTGFVDAPSLTDTYLKWNGSSFEWASVAGSGTVTSVALALPSEFSVSGSPITTAGTLTGAWASQTANYVFAAPNGSAGTPSFRAIVADDIPTLNQNTTGQAGSVSHSVTFDNNGTGSASGASFNGSAARTISYNTIGAPKADGTGASGTWAIDISGNAATATNVSGGAANKIVYNTGLSTTSFVDAPTLANTFLEWSGTGFQWSSNPSGDVSGPSSSTDNAVVRFDGTTGKLIQNSAVTIADDGTTVISTSSASDALRITQTGAGNALLVEDSANPDSTPVVVNASGVVIVGTTSAVGGSKLQVADTTSSAAVAISAWRAASSGGGALLLNKSRSGTPGTYSIVSSGDAINTIRWSGDDGTAFIAAAEIVGTVDGAPSTGSMPGRLTFSTTASGASTSTERMRIDSSGQVGIGATPSAGRTLTISKSITGSTTGFGLLQNGQVQSDVTTTVYGVRNDVSTAATAFTLASYYHYYAQQNTIGAGSSITSQYGFYVGGSLTGATNNYGFTGAIASGTGRWNLYMSGTAQNYFAGNVGIGSGKTTPATALDVNGTVTATDFSGAGTSLTGTASGLSIGGNAATATTATNATNVATTATATNADFYIPFVSASTTGNQSLGVDAGLSYNPSTNAITAGISGGTF